MHVVTRIDNLQVTARAKETKGRTIECDEREIIRKLVHKSIQKLELTLLIDTSYNQPCIHKQFVDVSFKLQLPWVLGKCGTLGKNSNSLENAKVMKQNYTSNGEKGTRRKIKISITTA